MSSGDLYCLLVFHFREPERGPGSLIAALLGIKFKKAFPAIMLGICMATVIMWFVSYVLLGGVHLLG